MLCSLNLFSRAAVAVVVTSLIEACSGSPILPDLTASFTEAKPVQAKPAAPPLALVALRPLVGTSPEFVQAMARELNERSKSRSLALIADPTATADTVLTGSFKVRRSKGASIIDYNWDVMEANGGLRHRANGSETVTLPKGVNEPWSVLSPEAMARIADKAYEALGTDMPKSDITTSSFDKVERFPAKP